MQVSQRQHANGFAATEPLDRLQTIGDGFRVEAHIVVWRAADAVKVPVGALFREGPGWAVFDGRQSMRDDEAGAAFAHGVERLLHQALGFVVEGGGRFVEDQYRRVLQ